jgi:Zn-dependent peptidase ImmA (M78 family)
MKAFAVPLMFDRRALADKAMKTAINARLKAGRDLISPICIYGLAEALGVRVTFADINMEGMYQRSAPPRIFVSSLRPLPRRNYTCAHELGHHLFGHGSSVDELKEHQTIRPWDVPEEYSANTFASYALMPTLGLRHAFVARGLAPETATPADLFVIAGQFGVGYDTLVTHLQWGERLIGRDRADTLRKIKPATIRAQILGQIAPQPLVIADEAWASPFIDAEVGHLLLVPPGVTADGVSVGEVATVGGRRLLEAVRPGIARLSIPGSSWAVFVRVARNAYAGRAEFRHLEEEADD